MLRCGLCFSRRIKIVFIAAEITNPKIAIEKIESAVVGNQIVVAQRDTRFTNSSALKLKSA